MWRQIKFGAPVPLLTHKFSLFVCRAQINVPPTAKKGTPVCVCPNSSASVATLSPAHTHTRLIAWVPPPIKCVSNARMVSAARNKRETHAACFYLHGRNILHLIPVRSGGRLTWFPRPDQKVCAHNGRQGAPIPARATHKGLMNGARPYPRVGLGSTTSYPGPVPRARQSICLPQSGHSSRDTHTPLGASTAALFVDSCL